MQSVSSRIWTRVAVSISYDDNRYTEGTFSFLAVTELESHHQMQFSVIHGTTSFLVEGGSRPSAGDSHHILNLIDRVNIHLNLRQLSSIKPL